MDFTWDVQGKTPLGSAVVRKPFVAVTSRVRTKKEARAAAERDVQLTEALSDEHASIVVVADMAGVALSWRVYEYVRHGLRLDPRMPAHTLVVNTKPWATRVLRWARKLGVRCSAVTLCTEAEVPRALEKL
jgi:hypothetical protein